MERAIEEVRQAVPRYEMTSRDPYNLGLYLHDLNDAEVVLTLRQAAIAVAQSLRVGRSTVRAAQKREESEDLLERGRRKKKDKRARSRSPSPRRYKAKPCARCGTHNNMALSEARRDKRQPSYVEWQQWHRDNPRHMAPEGSSESNLDEEEEEVLPVPEPSVACLKNEDL